MLKEKTLNKVKVKPLVNTATLDEAKVRGSKLIANPYSTIFLCAKRKSGKTSVIGEILKNCTDRKTILWIFCPTANIDDNWKLIIKMLQDRGSVVNVFDSIMENKKTNRLQGIIDELLIPEEDEEIEKKKIKHPEKPVVRLLFDGPTIEEEIKEEKKEKYKPKKIAPKHVFIFDDLSHELKNPSIQVLLKNGRHIRAMCLLSFQYCNDLLPSCWKQCEYAMIFRSFSKDKLEHLHRQLDLTMPLDQFIDIYDYAHRDRGYDFLYIDVKPEKFRRNFNKEIEYEKIE